ncbi:MAG: tetratricopeptide repeat protein, partial [Myxococcota bacterium]
DLPMAMEAGLPMAMEAGLPLARGAYSGDNLPLAQGDLDLPSPADNLPLPVDGADLPALGDDRLPTLADERDLLPSPHRGAEFGDLDFDPDGDLKFELDDDLELEDRPPGGDPLDDDLVLDPPAPVAASASPTSTPSEVGQEFAPEEGFDDDAPVVDGARGDPRVKVRKKGKKAVRLAIVSLLVLAIGGGLLSFTPLGPYGAYAIIDAVNASSNQEGLQSFRASAKRALAQDTNAKITAIFGEAQSKIAESPRFVPMKAYAAYLAFYSSLRFGENLAQSAQARQYLDSIPPEETDPLVMLARAARVAADGNLEGGFSQSQSAAQAMGTDLDALALRALIALKLEKKDTLALWEEAAQTDRTARTVYGLALAKHQAGADDEALALADEVLKLSAQHAGARTLKADILATRDLGDDSAIEILLSVTEKGPVRLGASKGELVLAYSLLGDLYRHRAKTTAAEKAYKAALGLNPKSVEALVGNGELFFLAGRYSEALARFVAAVKADRTNIDAQIGQGKTLLSLERFGDAKKGLAAAAKTSTHPLVRGWLGKVLEAEGDFEGAEKAYREAVAKAPDSKGTVLPYVWLSELFTAQGLADEAAKVLEEASQKLPDDPQLSFAKGLVALKSHRIDEAKRELNQTLEKQPTNIVRFYLAVAHRKAAEYDEAKKYLEEVAKTDADFPGLALEQGLWFEATGKTDEALKQYRAALAKAPDDDDLKLRVGSTMVVSGQARQALPKLREVFRARPQSAEANHFLGRAMLAIGDNIPEALGYLQAATRYDNNRAEYHLYVARAANLLNNLSVAQTSIDRALEIDKNLGDAYWQLGVLLLGQGNTLDALKQLEIALEKNPLRYDAYATMARCYVNQVNYSRAEEAWRKAIEGKPHIAEWHFRLGKLLFDHGSKDEAAEELATAVELVEQQKLQPIWLWQANFFLAESIRYRDKDRAIKAYKAYLKQAGPKNAYREDALNALETLEGR